MEGALLIYALDAHGKMVSVDDVPNGLACNCRCPQCHELLIAKNGGEIKVHHFAHVGGSECKGAYETALHILAKEIIATEKRIMVPKYLLFNGKKFKGYPYFHDDDDDDECDYDEDEKIEAHQIVFKNVELEKRNDVSTLQPDCVGITEDGERIHIEIFVTHGIDGIKRSKIINHSINCVEIKIPRNFPLERQKLLDYIINSTDGRKWINNPETDNAILNRKYAQQRQIIEDYRNHHPECKAIRSGKCDDCKIYQMQLLNDFRKFINQYEGKLLHWAEPLLKLSPQEILDKHICLKKTSAGMGVYINGCFYWITPRNNEYESDEHHMKCDATLKFLKSINNRCEKAIENLEYSRTDCRYFKKQFEYQNQWYVFCSHEKWR